MSTINNPAKKSLSAIFDKNVYHIPKYQRAYSWEEANWIELWSDIENYAFEANKEHFLGAIIHYHNLDNINSKYTHFDVIDGQQRLTTLTILVRVIYEKLKLSDKEVYNRFADEIFEKFLADKSNDCYFLNLSKKDDSFFKDYIQKVNTIRTKQGKLTSNKNIRKCFEFFSKKIEIFINEDSNPYEKIWDLKKRIEANLIFVVIDVNTDEDAYMIFESINSKRQGLTISDLLKNYIFMAADQHERVYPDSNKISNIEISWDSMEGTLEKIEVNQYIRHYWISRYEKVFEKDLYQKIKQKLGTSYVDILNFYDEIINEADVYASIVNATVAGLTPEGQRSHEQLKSLRNRQYYPLLLSILSSPHSIQEVSEFIEKIASVAVRRAIIGKNPNELETFFAENALNYRNGKISLKDLIKKLSFDFSITDEDIESELQSVNFRDQEYLAKFLLREYENSYHTTNEKKLVSVSLEHVLPQNPENIGDWDLAGKPLEEVVWNIGNLALIDQKINNKMSNKSFEKKKNLLAKSQLKSTLVIADSEEWSYSEILNRSKLISKFVISYWKN